MSLDSYLTNASGDRESTAFFLLFNWLKQLASIACLDIGALISGALIKRSAESKQTPGVFYLPIALIWVTPPCSGQSLCFYSVNIWFVKSHVFTPYCSSRRRAACVCGHTHTLAHSLDKLVACDHRRNVWGMDGEKSARQSIARWTKLWTATMVICLEKKIG